MDLIFNTNVLQEILLNADFQDLKHLARLNKTTYGILKLDKFWEYKYKKDFKITNLVNYHDWKEEYRIKFRFENPKKIYRLACAGLNINHILNLQVSNKKEAYKYIAYACNNKIIDEQYVCKLISQHYHIDTMIPSNIMELCAEYTKNNPELSSYDQDPTFLARHCYSAYLLPKNLYFRQTWMIKDTNVILKFFKYMYSKGFCVDKVKEPFELKYDVDGKIERPIYTPDDIEIMIGVNNRSMCLLEEICYI